MRRSVARWAARVAVIITVAWWGGVFSVAPVVAAPAGKADVSAELVTGPYGAKPGERVTHRITVRNVGTATAQGVTMWFLSTAAMSSVDATTPAGKCTTESATKVVCTLGELASGAGREVAVVIAATLTDDPPPLGGLVKNSAIVATATEDSQPANDASVNGYLWPVSASATPTPVAYQGQAGRTASVADKAAAAAHAPSGGALGAAVGALDQAWLMPTVACVIALVALVFTRRQLNNRATHGPAGQPRRPGFWRFYQGRHRGVPHGSIYREGT